MNEQSRLEELFDYQILDTKPERELDELAEVASAVCGTPVSVISFIDSARQWYKAKVGTTDVEVNRIESFCQYTLDKPDELLIVEDVFKDERFNNNPFVKNAPFIRFYAGAPLVSTKGHVLGTLCVFNTVPMRISDIQRNALTILARKVMHYLDARKLIMLQGERIESSVEKLKKITDQAPGVIYQFTMSKRGVMKFNFVSQGISKLHPALQSDLVRDHPEHIMELVHPDDVQTFRKSIEESFRTLTPWQREFRIRQPEGNIRWFMALAEPERRDDGTVVWYGSFQEITSRIEYETMMEQIAFDISHVLRRPVTTLLGLTNAVAKEEQLDDAKLRMYSSFISSVSTELEAYTSKLNKIYSLKSQIIKGHGERTPG
jgi:PAS domain-containing protein